MKTSLVAGGGGFIGSHLCDLLIAKDHRVIAVDNFATGQKSNLPYVDNLTVIEADIRTTWQTWLPESKALEVDEIYNLASPASPVDFAKMAEFILTTASEGHRNLLQLAKWMQNHKAAKVPVLFASTSEVYGDPLTHPQPESYWGNVNPVGERSCYDEAKRFGEALSIAYRNYGVPAKIARIFNTYGSRMRSTDGRVICNFIDQARLGKPLTIYGDGMQTRSFCHVDDLVNGLHALMTTQFLGPVNLGNPNEFTIIDAAKIICEITGIEPKFEFVPLPPDDPKRRRPDISLAKQHLNWEPKISFAEGIKRMMS